MTPNEAVETLVNGNVTDFKLWAKYCTKAQILDAILAYADMVDCNIRDSITFIKRLVP